MVPRNCGSDGGSGSRSTARNLYSWGQLLKSEALDGERRKIVFILERVDDAYDKIVNLDRIHGLCLIDRSTHVLVRFRSGWLQPRRRRNAADGETVTRPTEGKREAPEASDGSDRPISRGFLGRTRPLDRAGFDIQQRLEPPAC